MSFKKFLQLDDDDLEFIIDKSVFGQTTKAEIDAKFKEFES